MTLFNRLFGKKPNTKQAVATEQIQKQEDSKPQNKESVSEQVSQLENTPTKPGGDERVTKDHEFGETKPVSPKKEKSQPLSEPETAEVKTLWRTFPIFISSTFADMQAERDHLKNVVFPKVEEELQKRRIKLEIVDLRWGVDTTSMEQEEEREVNVLKVCLDEIRRCRPFFIGLLGDRYGWVPPLKRLETALVGEPHIKPEEGKSVTDLEMEFGVLASQEQLVRSVFYFREPLNYEKFSAKKAAMFSDAYNPDLSEAEKTERKDALEKLKVRIVDHFEAKKLSNKVKTYTGTWNVEKEKLTELLSELKPWGDTVYNDILAECKNHAKDTWDKVPKNWQEQELALLNAFVEQHTHITTTLKDGKPEQVHTFCGREELLKELSKHLLSDDSDNWGKVLTGESGSGKSAVFSMITKKMQESKDCFVLAHSAGLSPRAKSVADLLKIWNKQLADFLGIKDETSDDAFKTDDFAFRLSGVQNKDTATPIEKLQEKFLELLRTVATQKRVILLIDALDRFEPTARAQHLSWLPTSMPQNVRLLCTAITGTEQKAVQYHKGLTPKSIDKFSKTEAEQMLNSLMNRNHKTLNETIRKIIIEKKRKDDELAISSPLWLSLAVNILMAIDQDDFEKISKLDGKGGEQIDAYLIRLANDFSPLPGPLFISLIEKAGAVFGSSFTKAVFDYLAISRNGLREKDLAKLLHDKNWDSLQYANLRRWFKVHLVLQGEELQWNLAHSILRKAVIQNIEEPQRLEIHGSIAEYLMPLLNDQLKSTETMYHLLNAGNNYEGALYYIRALTDEEIEGATKTLAELVTSEGSELELVVSLMKKISNNKDNFILLLERFVFQLDNLLAIQGNLDQRLNLLCGLNETLEKTFFYGIEDEKFIYTKASLKEKLGEIYEYRGQFMVALDYFKDSFSLFKDFNQGNSFNLSFKIRIAFSIERLALIYQMMGQLEMALNYSILFNQYMKDIFIAKPQNEFFKECLAISYERLGNIQEVYGDLAESLYNYEQFNQLIKELFSANSRNEKLKENLAISYGKIGEIYQKINNFEKALIYFEKAIKIKEELYFANPDKLSYKIGLSISHERLGEIFQSVGQIDNALIHFRIRSKFAIELFNSNKESEILKNGLAVSYLKLGELYQELKHIDDALYYFELYYLQMNELYSNNHLNIQWIEGLSISNYKLAMIYKLVGNNNKGKEFFAECKKFIAFLATNLPQVAKYREWEKLEY